MTHEHLTNEELARLVLQAKDGNARYVIPPKTAHYSMTYTDAMSVRVETATFVELAHELARRITTSIPKPVVEVTFDDFHNAYYIVVNDQRCGRFIYDRIMANTLADDIRHALGLEGGGDG